MNENMKSIMVVDYDEQMRAALNEAVTRMGYNTVLAEKPARGLDKETLIGRTSLDLPLPLFFQFSLSLQGV